MNLTWKNKLLIASVVLLLCLNLVYGINLTPNALSIEVERMQPEEEDLYQVYYNRGGGFNETDSIIATTRPDERQATIHFSGFPALQVKSLRIDPGKREAAIRIASITLQHEYRGLKMRVPLYQWTGEKLITDFTPLHHIRDWALTEQGLSLMSTGDDPYFVYRNNWQTILDSAAIIASRVSWLLYGCCLLFAAAIYGILSSRRVCRLIVTFVKAYERIFINLLIMFAMLLSYLLFASRFLPEGINSVFVSSIWMWVLVLLTVVFLMLLIFVSALKEKPFKKLKSLERFQAQDAILLMLPITPVVQYLILNQNTLKVTDFIIILIFFIGLAFIVSLVVPWLLSIAGSRTVLMSVGLSLTYVLLNMSALASNFNWHLAGDLPIQSSIFIVITAFLLFLYKLDRKKTYWVVACFFLFNTAMTIVKIMNDQPEIAGANATIPTIYSSVDGKRIKSTPDIFLLVYESYSNQETMLHYGFDNSAQIQFLK